MAETADEYALPSWMPHWKKVSNIGINIAMIVVAIGLEVYVVVAAILVFFHMIMVAIQQFHG